MARDERLKEMLAWGEETGQKTTAAHLCGLIFDEDIRRWNDRGVAAIVEKAGVAMKAHVYYGRSLAKHVSPNYDVLRKFRG